MNVKTDTVLQCSCIQLWPCLQDPDLVCDRLTIHGTSTAIYYKMRGQVTKWTQNDIQTDWETDKQIVHEKIYFTYGKEIMTFNSSSKAHGKLSDWISYPNWAHTKDTVNPLNKTRQSHNWLQKLKKYK